jgi:undecaprenyl-diphosphatase
VAGVLLKDLINSVFRDALWVAAFLIITAFVFLAAERFLDYKIERKGTDKINWKDALFIGLAQIFSLLPGVSRSGVTISAGMFRSLKRIEAVRFSFLMAALVIFGAGLFSMFEMFRGGYMNDHLIEILMGFLASTVVGYLSIKYLIKYLRKRKLNVFAVYMICLGLVVIILQWF